ncbi:hypothetical protein H8A95_19900 [Bradyrhizobium sp. Pear76]|uniref:hypothetical protein n=1 Tax=Bradyrhizobium oropedii TaxID=1571201 RepID=UPI001E441C45|nr:hypothetical protein [Bradyrhizobium oropedii]MCC8964518.1 hypothetical protein [Bradyrhizobium oropedii]
MDMKEASAMTEASGLIEEQDGSGRTSEAIPRRPQQPSRDVALRWAERLRAVAVKAPLQSLFVAFLIGIWVARRR